MDIEVEGAVAKRHIRPTVRRSPSAVSSRADEIGVTVDAARVGSASSHYRDIVVDFVGGCVSGCAGIFVGQPFDTVKVRLQTSKVTYPGSIACARVIVEKEGPLALFKGMSTPIASAAFINAISFGAYAQSQRVVESYGLASSVGEGSCDVAEQGGEAESTGRVTSRGLVWSWVGGSFAGLCQSVVVTPTENIKIKLQVQVGARGSNTLKYTGPIDCAVKIVRAEGVGGLFRGGNVTILRETPAMGLYFACYEWAKGCLERRWQWSEQASSFGAGGLSGALSWVTIYPFDVVKSVQQASNDPLDPYSRSMTACFRKLYREAGGGVPGVSRFFAGVGTTVARAFPVNAVIFPVYEWTVKILNQGAM